MRVLALEPYYGGSHRAFLDGWSRRSRHEWTILHLPAYKWKWRMRHAAITFTNLVSARYASGERWDMLFCSDMLNLAEFRGLVEVGVANLPSVAYFHENQLTYPVRHESERDYHFVFTNMTTALAATAVWFNSAYHRDSFLGALPAFLERMPDHQPFDAVEHIAAKSTVQPQGIDEFPPRGERRPGPLRILWAARWEHDKNPDTFFETLHLLKSKSVDFRVSVIGEQFREMPPVFESARRDFTAQIDRWGYQESRQEYVSALREADVIVSTALHEFFGISIVEAVAAGAYPLLPERLAYPEILSDAPNNAEHFYDGSANELAARLGDLARLCQRDGPWQGDEQRASRAVAKYEWSTLAGKLDRALEAGLK